MNGKGDKPRPVDRKRYAENFEAIRWKSRKERKDEPRMNANEREKRKGK